MLHGLSLFFYKGTKLGGRNMSENIEYEEIKVGDKIPTLKIKLTAEKNKHYNRLVKEINPLHFNADYAKGLGYKDIVIAGVFTSSFFVKLVTDWIGEHKIKDYEIFFHDPAYINDELIHEGKVISKSVIDGNKMIQCETWSLNQAGEKLATANFNLIIK